VKGWDSVLPDATIIRNSTLSDIKESVSNIQSSKQTSEESD